MELDEFKSVLKLKLEAGATRRSASELEQYVQRKAQSLITKVKRSMVFEFIFGILCMAIFTWAFFRYTSIYTRFFAALTVVFCIFLIGYLVRLLRKITFYENSFPSVKESLQQVIDILQRFTKLYFRLSMLTLPVAFLLGLIMGYLDISQQGLSPHFQWTKGILFYTGVFVFWSALMYFFSKWYIKKLYGNYMEQLKARLKDLENG